MAAIWKYPVRPGKFVHQMPKGARILNVQAQGDKPMMWALVDPQAQMEVRAFLVVPTGKEFLSFETDTYLGTFQLDGGTLVFHVFEFGDS